MTDMFQIETSQNDNNGNKMRHWRQSTPQCQRPITIQIDIRKELIWPVIALIL